MRMSVKSVKVIMKQLNYVKPHAYCTSCNKTFLETKDKKVNNRNQETIVCFLNEIF